MEGLSRVSLGLSLSLSFAAGAVSVLLGQRLRPRLFEPKATKDRKANAGAVAEGNDLSLYYGNDPDNPDNADQAALTTLHERCQFLPSDLYAAVVRNTVVCCVDILLVRTTGTGYKEALLVERSSEPAKGLWWLPGGRLLKGETFFQAALRKARQETGLAPHVLRAIQIIGVYNTFFPTSAWDTPEAKGTQTVNPIVLVELLSTTTADAKIQLDAQSERYRWISLAPTDNTTEDKYVQQALLRLHAWNPHYSRTASS